MKVHKIVLLVIDFEQSSEEDIRTMLERCKHVDPTVMSFESAEIGEWHDDHPLNGEQQEAEFKRLFPS